eukprot:COSAG02_NODE_23_length_52893_cov_58.101868_11_plen_449_part_00
MGRKKGDAPLMRTCYICGRGFGSSSLAIHEPQCLVKWKAQNELLPPEQRRPQPVRPDTNSSSVEEQNAAAEAAYDSNLAPCPHCGRTFNPDRLQVHLRSCTAESGSRPVAGRAKATSAAQRHDHQTPPQQSESKPRPKKSRRNKGAAPLMRTCYICGRGFGSSSLAIHEPQCLVKWKAQNELLPPEQRRPQPVRPDTNSSSVEEQNAAAEAAYDSNLAPCPHCGRTFNPDRLQVHLRSCTAESGSRPVAGRAKALPSQAVSSLGSDKLELQTDGTQKSHTKRAQRKKGDAPMMLTCYICGRGFGSASLDIHQPQCLKKWEAQNELLPPEQRRPCPVAPVLVRNGNDVSDIAAMNAAAAKAHEGILAPCPHCGRTFNPERLVVHLRSCGGNHGTSKPVKTRHQIEARSVFRKIDRNSNGELDWSELHHVSPITVYRSPRKYRHLLAFGY